MRTSTQNYFCATRIQMRTVQSIGNSLAYVNGAMRTYATQKRQRTVLHTGILSPQKNGSPPVETFSF